MTQKTPKENLREQLRRLKLDDDLELMVEDGIAKISDERATLLAHKLKTALDAFPGIIREVIEELKKTR